MLKLLSPIFFSILVASCADPVDETTSGQHLVFDFHRGELSNMVTNHNSTIDDNETLQSLIWHELDHAVVVASHYDEMQAALRSLGDCTPMKASTDLALDALFDLGVEFRAHEVGMATMIDLDTARAADINFKARQMPLIGELWAHSEAMRVSLDDADCKN